MPEPGSQFEYEPSNDSVIDGLLDRLFDVNKRLSEDPEKSVVLTERQEILDQIQARQVTEAEARQATDHFVHILNNHLDELPDSIDQQDRIPQETQLETDPDILRQNILSLYQALDRSAEIYEARTHLKEARGEFMFTLDPMKEASARILQKFAQRVSQVLNALDQEWPKKDLTEVLRDQHVPKLQKAEKVLRSVLIDMNERNEDLDFEKQENARKANELRHLEATTEEKKELDDLTSADEAVKKTEQLALRVLKNLAKRGVPQAKQWSEDFNDLIDRQRLEGYGALQKQFPSINLNPYEVGFVEILSIDPSMRKKLLEQLQDHVKEINDWINSHK